MVSKIYENAISNGLHQLCLIFSFRLRQSNNTTLVAASCNLQNQKIGIELRKAICSDTRTLL